MKKLLITNLVTAVVVLGIIAAYSFKPEQKAGAKYATLNLHYWTPSDFNIVVSVDGKSEEIRSEKGKMNTFEFTSSMSLQINQQLEKLESQGYQLISTDAVNLTPNVQGGIQRTYTLRKP